MQQNRLNWLRLVFVLFGLGGILLHCGSDDSSSNGGTDAGTADTAESDSGEYEQITESTSEISEVEELGDDAEGTVAVNTLMASTTDAVDALDEQENGGGSQSAGGGGIWGGGSRECRTVSFNGTGILNATSIVIDYDNCTHIKGQITLHRLDLEKWLLSFSEDFEITNMSVDGYLVVNRESIGHYRLYTCDSTGGNMGGEPILLTWTGQNKTLSREVTFVTEVVVGGNLQSPRFEITGEGRLNNPENDREHLMGLGGKTSSDKDTPLLYPRPLTNTCPDSGILALDGKFAATLKTVIAFTLGKKVHNLEVSLIDHLVDAVMYLPFDKLQSLGIGTVTFIPNGQLAIPEDSILAALAQSSLADSVKTAIQRYLDQGNHALISESLIEQALTQAFNSLYTTLTTCNAL